MFSYATGTSSSSSSSANNRNNNNNNSSSRENCRNSTNQNNSSNPRGQSFKFNFNESFRKIYDDFQDIKVSFDDISKNIPEMNKIFNISKTSCNSCNSVNSNIFARKRKCGKCSLTFCSQCMVYNPVPPRKSICNRCTVFSQHPISKEALNSLKVRDLKWFLASKNISSHHCYEKSELIDLIISFRNETSSSSSSGINSSTNAHQRRHSYANASASSNNDQQHESNSSSSNNHRQNFYETSSHSSPTSFYNNLNNQSPSSTSFESHSETVDLNPNSNDNDTINSNSDKTNKQANKTSPSSSSSSSPMNIKLNDIKNEEEIRKLSVKQLKLLLTRNFVNFKGCVEREELVGKVLLLYNDKKQNDILKDQLETEKASINSGGGVDENQCKICWENVIDCVLLDCGHMLTCTDCGKVLSECPICRQFITRVVHVFKS